MKIVALGSLLVLLAAFLILPFLSGPEPPVRFVSLGTDPSAAEPSGLIAAADSVPLVSRLQLDSLFRKLHELNPGQVKEPAAVTTLPELRNAVQPNEKLVLYCGVPARAESDPDASDTAFATMVVLHPGPVAAEIRWEKLLDTLKQADADQIVLLVDVVDLTPGLANGILNDDVVELLHTSVRNANIPGLSLICSSTAGQRSWEFLAGSDVGGDSATTVASVAPEVGTESANATFGLFSGTVFAHFVGEAFIAGKTTNARQLGEYLQTNVAEWVRQHYGDTQTVTLLGRNVQDDNPDELLRNGGWSAEELAGTPDPLDPTPTADAQQGAVAESDSAAGTDKNPSSAEAADVARESPETKLGKLLKATRSLDPNCRAIDPTDWMNLNGLLIATRKAMLQGDRLTYAVMYDRAGARLDDIGNALKKAAAADTENDFAPWIHLPHKPTADQAAQKAVAQEAAVYLQQSVATSPEEKLQQLPRNLWGQPFADAFVKDLTELAETVSGNPASQAALIAPRVRLIQYLRESRPGSWPQKDWPQQLLTIDEVLGSDGADADQQPLPLLVELIALRQQSLAMAAGFASDGSRVRVHAWQAERSKLEDLLTELTAVERWLAMGSPGFSMAEQTLTKARNTFSDLNDSLQNQQKRSAIQDAQQTDLLFLIQYLAQQHEQVSLTTRELDAALQLADSQNPRQQFPEGLLKQLEMDSVHIDAMFALTRNLKQAPVTDTDLRDHNRLQTYVVQRISSPLTTVEERHRLLSVPGFETSVAELVSGLQRNGPKAVTGNNQTGIWLAFWSIRLLDAVTQQAHPELWETWKSLVQQVQDKSDQTVLVRTQLATQLRTHWAKFQVSLKDSSNASVFVSRTDCATLISQDLKQRHQASQRNAGQYAKIHQTLFNDTLPPRNIEFSVVRNEVKVEQIDKKDQVGIEVKSAGGAAIYVSRSRFDLQQVQTELKKDWLRLDNDQPHRNLVFRATNPLTETVPLTLALVNSADVVLATQDVIVHAGTDAKWELEFLLDNRPLPLLDGKELQLPPTTTDRKDAVLPLTVRLTQHNGAVRQVQVQAYTFPDGQETRLWNEPQTLDVVDQQVVIPLTPATPAAAAEPTVAAAPPIDLLNGIRFEVQPLGFETTSTTINIEPVLFADSHFVRTPEANYDAASRTLTISVQPKDHPNDALWPEKLPVEIHFSPALNRLRQGEAASKAPALPDDGQTFVFVFREEIEQAFRDDSQIIANERNLEFGLSVAGIPHAWQWHLQDAKANVLLPDNAPIVRASLTLSADNKAKPVPTDKPSFLFAKVPGSDYVEPIFDIEMHIFRSGTFQRTAPEWELQLRVQNTETEQSTPALSSPIPLTSRHRQTITASAGKKSMWNFSTHTESYQRRNLQISRELGLGAGSYKLIAGAKKIGRTDGQPQEHEIPFVIDATPPKVTVSVPNRHSVLQPLTGSINADDRESGVQKFQVTMEGGKPVPVTNNRFTIPITQFPNLQPGEGQEKTERQTITVVVTNGAGLESEPVKQNVVFFKQGPPKKKMAPKPIPPGVVVFESTTVEPKILLWDVGNQKVAEGGGSKKIELKDIPPGTYKLTWTGPPSGLKIVTVESGKTATVSP